MSVQARSIAPWLVAAGATMALVVAPIAAADATTPQVGQSPVDAIANLEEQGYLVTINWTKGPPEVPLSECTLTDIHDPGMPGPTAGRTVYLDISCPSNDNG